MVWTWNASPIEAAAVTASALLLSAIGLFGLLRRGHWLTTLLFSSAFLSLAAFEAGTLGMVNAETIGAARTWSTYLARNSALVSWLWLALSVVLGRQEPRQQLRSAGAYLVLSLFACAVLWGMAESPYVVQEVIGHGPGTLVVFGPLGKLYLIYLIVAMVVVLMNLESMLRDAPSSGQKRVRALFAAILVAILTELLVLSGGLLVGGLRVSGMVTAAPVVFVAGCVAALALARRRLSDMDVPVARPVIYYSSVSLTLAGAFMLGVLVLSRLVPALTPQWKAGVTLAFLAFVGGGGLLLMASPATSRTIRRFIDRNFYANRYDYRREWERVSSALTPNAPLGQIAQQIERLVASVFDAPHIVLHLYDEERSPLVRLHGPPAVPASLPADHPLVRHLESRLLPIVFRDLERDLDLIPLVVESRPVLEAFPAAVCAPLAIGERLVGLMWVSARRSGEDWSVEDVEFLAAMSRQVASVLWFSRQTERLIESRQLESLHRLSSHVLHDIKNQVSGLSLVVENARLHFANPDFQRDALAVVENAVRSLRELMNQVSGVSRSLRIEPAPCPLRDLVDDALAAAGFEPGGAPNIRITVTLRESGEVVLDRAAMTRVLVNLLTNAREGFEGAGEIGVEGSVVREDGAPPEMVLQVRDNGRGMSEEFVRTRLFRPFSSTKSNGLGIGLAQCRTIVEAHGGRIEVDSRPGRGTTFTVRVPAAGRLESPQAGWGAGGPARGERG